MKLPKLVEEAGWKVKVFTEAKQRSFKPQNSNPTSLLSEKLEVEPKYSGAISKPVSIMLSGSAGEGVQLAAEFLARAAMLSGLYATKKEVTRLLSECWVFSCRGDNFTRTHTLYWLSCSRYLAITSADGLGYARTAAGKMKGGTLYIDQSLDIPKQVLKRRDSL